jgi:uncharacterized protein YndB with AHSA1/START domain
LIVNKKISAPELTFWKVCQRQIINLKQVANYKEYTMKITVETIVNAPIAKVWSAYTTPEDIKQRNTASDDWHTTKSTVDLRVGGAFTSRMEAKNGSFGFDFAGMYTKILPKELIEYSFGDRTGTVEFLPVQMVSRFELFSTLNPKTLWNNSVRDGKPS